MPLKSIRTLMQEAGNETEPFEPRLDQPAGDESPMEKVKSLLAGKVDAKTLDAILKLIEIAPHREEGKDLDCAMDKFQKDICLCYDQIGQGIDPDAARERAEGMAAMKKRFPNAARLGR